MSFSTIPWMSLLPSAAVAGAEVTKFASHQPVVDRKIPEIMESDRLTHPASQVWDVLSPRSPVFSQASQRLVFSSPRPYWSEPPILGDDMRCDSNDNPTMDPPWFSFSIHLQNRSKSWNTCQKFSNPQWKNPEKCPESSYQSNSPRWIKRKLPTVNLHRSIITFHYSLWIHLGSKCNATCSTKFNPRSGLKWDPIWRREPASRHGIRQISLL